MIIGMLYYPYTVRIKQLHMKIVLGPKGGPGGRVQFPTQPISITLNDILRTKRVRFLAYIIAVATVEVF